MRLQSVLYAVGALLFCVVPYAADAASLVITPAASSLSIGDTGTFVVRVDSVDQAVNAVSGVIMLSPEVELVSVNKESSVVNFWVEEPVSGKSQTFSFEGVILNPGYQGSGGNIVSVVVRAKESGTGTLTFSQGAVYANDGEGTHVLSEMEPATVVITDKVSPREPEPTPKASVTNSPLPVSPPSTNTSFSSPDFPQETGWYAKSTASLLWEMPQGATATRVQHSAQGKVLLSERIDTAVTTYVLSTIPEGVSTISLQHMNRDGVWSKPKTIVAQSDVTPPRITSVQELPRVNVTSGRVRLHVVADDTLSGLDRYSFHVDGVTADWKNDGSGIFDMLLPPGTHTIKVTVTDRAGNSDSQETEVFVEALDSPEVVLFPSKVKSEEAFEVHGKGTPGARVELFFHPISINSDPLNQGASSVVALNLRRAPLPSFAALRLETTVQAEGTFTATVPGSLSAGMYDLWTIEYDEQDGQSLPQGPHRIVVTSSGQSVFGGMTSVAALVTPLIVIVPILMLLSGLFAWRYIGFRRTVRREVEGVERSFERAFQMMQDEVVLELGKLSNNEPPAIQQKASAAMKALASNINDTKAYIHEEMGTLEQVLEEPAVPIKVSPKSTVK